MSNVIKKVIVTYIDDTTETFQDFIESSMSIDIEPMFETVEWWKLALEWSIRFKAAK